MEVIDKSNIDGQFVAQYFKYRLQFKYSYIINKVDFRRIASKSLYKKYKKYFDKIVIIFKKYNIDILDYVKFFVGDYGKTINDIQTNFLNIKSIIDFLDNIKIRSKKKKIYNSFIKTSEIIANECINFGFLSSKDYLKEIILKKKIAQYFFTGKISLYWLAGIPNFKKIINKLDNISKQEFSDIYSKFEIYNTEINEAFLQETNHKVNPIGYTDELIFKKKNNYLQTV